MNGTTDTMGRCVPCHTGYYCLGNMPKGKDTTPCMKGTYNPSRGAASLSNCIPANEGFHCPNEHMSAQLPCPAGEFSSAESFPDCIRVQIGFYSNATANESTPCRPGFACNQLQGTSFHDMLSTPCGPGTYSAGGASSCPDCSAGSFAGGPANLQCEPCLPGHSCSKGSAESTPCQAGSFASEGQASCTPCSAGYYSDEGNETCTQCEAGHFCVRSTSRTQMGKAKCGPGTYSAGGASSCQDCSPGRFSNLTVNSNCTSCRAGYYCKGSSQPAPCEKGTYRAVTGGSVADDCSKCQMGEYSDEDGSTACKVCSEGHSSLVGSTSARNCTYKVPILSGMLVSLTMTVFAGCGRAA